MTFQVFVGYGDSVAKGIAENLGSYLHRSSINSFVASTNPSWMLPSYSVGYIYQQLAQSDLLIATCTRHASLSSNLGREIRYAQSSKIPILPFLERGASVPFGLRNIWCIEFDVNSPWRQHRKIALYVLWLMEKRMETLAQV